MTKLLFVGCLAGAIGGQSRVALRTVLELQKLGYDITNVGKGTQVLEEGQSLPCPCVPWSEHDPAALHRIIEQIKPQLIVYSHDCWLYLDVIPEVKSKYPEIKQIGWFTIDAHPIHHSFFSVFRALDYICVSTRFGRDTIMQRWPEKAVEVIEYGIERDVYHIESARAS